MAETDVNDLILTNLGSHWGFVPRKKTTPPHCRFANQELKCMGCGVKLSDLQHGHCYGLEAEKALKPEVAKKE